MEARRTAPIHCAAIAERSWGRAHQRKWRLQQALFRGPGFCATSSNLGTYFSSHPAPHKHHAITADELPHCTCHACSCGPGSTDGCLSIVPLDVDGSAAARRSAPPRRDADVKRNIYTSTPKKGGFGRPWKDNCLGDPPKYYSDVYEAGRALEKVRQSNTGRWRKTRSCWYGAAALNIQWQSCSTCI